MRYEFTLHYRGPLKSKGNIKHKHELRKHFHKQLKQYVDTTSVKDMIDAVRDNLIIQRDNYIFLPLISDEIYMAGQIDIFLLKPGPPGAIVTQGGDIDNRLKTLLDSLKVPDPNAIPDGFMPEKNESPFFYCAFKDDSLIRKLTVSTDQLLEKTNNSTEVILFIRILGEETESFSITSR